MMTTLPRALSTALHAAGLLASSRGNFGFFPTRGCGRHPVLARITLSLAACLLCGCRLDVHHHIHFERPDDTVIIETDVKPPVFDPDVIVEIKSDE